MTEFVYNNAKNISINYTLLKFNYEYYYTSFLKKKSKSTREIIIDKQIDKKAEKTNNDLLAKYTLFSKITKKNI